MEFLQNTMHASGSSASVDPGDFHVDLDLRSICLAKIGVIDEGCRGTLKEEDKNVFESLSVEVFHSDDCKGEADATVISMSLGYDAEVAQKIRHPGNDVVGLELLHAIEKEVLTIVSIGNEGPIKESVVCCRPWTMIVGACTNGNILETIVEIAIKDENEGFMLLYTRLKGASLNVIDTQFLKLRESLYVRFLKSKYQNDNRNVFMSNFSSRGPSRLYEDNMSPDIVVVGSAVLVSHTTFVPLNMVEGWYRNCIIESGTSYACPLVAAYALIVYSCHPEWSPLEVKSALITTASSFAATCIPGSEFAYGAGSTNLELALSPGLVYNESYDSFEEYVEHRRTIFDLNLPTFVASFSYSHLSFEQIFKRELTNVGESAEEYTFSVQIFKNTLDPEVEIKAIPSCLKFEPGEKQKFELHVRVLPYSCPGSELSGMIIWESSTGGQTVRSLIHLYHLSKFDKLVWYKMDDDENEMDEGWVDDEE
ncbi:hypothetical protein DCAR_0830742 [Daucus carota subsp. sativus]|uniref:Uncharacterized protein n=1 Tax=Daucus carota subsp. sativus TaxID=79200 RepID=A0A175YMB8_DAUCS|nr:hypothetical protein DCAR_0830742 [Daucus carota subsp. sativus]